MQIVLQEVPRLQDIAPGFDAHVRNTRRHGTWTGEPTEYISVSGEGAVGRASRWDGLGASAGVRFGGARVETIGTTVLIFLPLAPHPVFLQTVSDGAFILADIVRKVGQPPSARAYVRAGVRSHTYFNPTTVRAAIVTCGGLCPGLNNVIRDAVETLWYAYGVETIYGVHGGYWGFHTPDADPATGAERSPYAPSAEPPLLTPASVAKAHLYGGTMLGADRGGHDVDIILRFCANRGVNVVLVVGGDGTHRGAQAIAVEAAKRGLPLSVGAIPKTIDNDVDLIDRRYAAAASGLGSGGCGCEWGE